MSHISPASKARLMREMSLLSRDPPPGVAAYAPEPSDMTKIRAQITGPEDSPFEGGVFLLSVNVTGRYPFEPPRCRFLTPVYHPNVDSGGRICLDTLKSPPAGSWSPAVSLPSLLLSIRSLMAEPNPDDGLVPDISELYKRNPAEWQREARRRTEVDATAQKLEEVESSLDRESAGGDAECENVAAGNGGKGARGADTDNGAEPSQRGSRGARTAAEADNVQNERQHKKSKLCSRK
jgi:ubiquitin-conjugating enzyme E2 T